MGDFSPILAALIGGSIIGISASMMLLLEGRILGISGIVGGFFAPKAGDISWRALFVAGLLTAGGLARFVAPERIENTLDQPLWVVAVAGLLVGFGTRLGSGCTSGHGICGMSRFSRRSMVSVGVFMGVGMVVAIVASKLAEVF